MKNFLTIIVAFSFFITAHASDDILDQKKYLKSALGVSELPMHKYLIIKDDIENGIYEIMNDTYHTPVIKYWKVGNKVAFILEAIGKHEYITTGYLVENNQITDAKVITYRENYGYEVKYDFFINQIKGNSLKSSNKLSKKLANISGATMSVNSMRKLSKLSLFLYTKV
tara:strand:+ start:135 stop:641 length:507 start_codon:yes stop_codon:yes gene_type:complete